jgi:dihydropteroate synthase
VRLRLRDRVFEMERGRPLLMGIVNATSDSFSDPQGEKDPGELVQRAHALVDAGAAIVDVGGESGRTDRREVSEAEETARIVPVVEQLVAAGVVVSVDTWRAGPARAALEAGAAMVNDVSGLADPALAELCARSGAGLVITHTRAAPKTKAFPPYGDVMADVTDLLGERSARARELGVGDEQLLLDPGIDLAKTPAESVEILRRMEELDSLGRPLLVAISRKDFVGALTGRPPRDRGAGTLAAIEPALDVAAAVLRVHDMAAAADFLAVRAALRGESTLPTGPLGDDLRREAMA